MDIICPHCGTEYDAEEGEYGRFVKCEICGKGFVAGAGARIKDANYGGQTSRPNRPLSGKVKGPSEIKRPSVMKRVGVAMGKLKLTAAISHAPWQIKFMSCYYVVYGVALSIVWCIWAITDMNLSDLLFSPLPAVFLGLMTILFLKCKWMYWLVIGSGAFALVVCFLGSITVFPLGLVVFAIMLMLPSSREWNRLREKREKSVSPRAAKKVAITAVSLAIISAFISFNAQVREIQDARSHFENPLADLPKDKGRAAYVYLLRQKRENKAAARSRYRKLLDIGNLRELYFVDGSNKDGVYYLNLEGPGGTICNIQWHFSPDGNHYFEWPSMIPRDVALEMMRLRLEISLP